MGKELKLSITKQLKELVYVKTEVTRFLDVNYVSSSAAYKINMVLEEVVASIINHSSDEDIKYTVRIFIGLSGREAIVEVIWRGHPFNPIVGIRSGTGDLEEMKEYELGAHVVKKLSKSALYTRRRESEENHLEIVMRSGLH